MGVEKRESSLGQDGQEISSHRFIIENADIFRIATIYLRYFGLLNTSPHIL